MLLLHGFTDTWRTWDLVLERLERHHEVLAPTLPGHAGGPGLRGVTDADFVSALAELMDLHGWATAHVCGNSLGGYLALHMAAAGRAQTVTALAPAGGWVRGDESYRVTLRHFTDLREPTIKAAPFADSIVATPAGRRRCSAFVVERYEHIPADLLAHQIRGAAACTAVEPLVQQALEVGWNVDASRVTCPTRIVWGTADKLLPWPVAAARYEADLPAADWVVLDDVGHCPQLDIPLETSELILGWTGASGARR